MAIAAAVAITVIALLGAPGTGHAAVDPFYLSLYSDGTQAYDRGDFATASRWLQLACFGLLDEPKPLGACLARLAVAQAQSGDGDGFRETFRRLVEVESGFSGYSQADLPSAVRSAFEQQAAARIPAEVLAASPVFSRLLVAKDAAKVEAMPPRARRDELEKRIAAEPKNAIWRILLGRLEVAEGRPALALAAAQAALNLAPGEPRAVCLRGLAQARLGSCQEALVDFAGCAETSQFATPAAARLGCLVERKNWDDARSFVASLPQALRDDKEISRLVRQLPVEGSDAPASAKVPAAAPGTVPAQSPKLSPAADTAPTATERAALPKVRELLGPEAPSRDLKRARDMAKKLADAHPVWREAQLTMAEAAYRNSRWAEAASYFRRSGDPGDDRPELLFYFAVSLFESGDRAGAASILKRSLPNLQPSPFVDEYTKKILREDGS